MEKVELLFWKIIHDKVLFKIILFLRDYYQPNKYEIGCFWDETKDELLQQFNSQMKIYVYKDNSFSYEYLSESKQFSNTQIAAPWVNEIKGTGFSQRSYRRCASLLVTNNNTAEKKALNILFVIDINSPHTYIEEEALQALAFDISIDENKPYNVKINGFNQIVYKSPLYSSFKTFNILGNNFFLNKSRVIFKIKGLYDCLTIDFKK